MPEVKHFDWEQHLRQAELMKFRTKLVALCETGWLDDPDVKALIEEWEAVAATRAAEVPGEPRRKLTGECIAAVRAATNLGALVAEYVTLQPFKPFPPDLLMGGGQKRGTCPFCHCGSGMFAVSGGPRPGVYFCHDCRIGGDAIKFLMDLLGMTFNEAVERLAQRVGIEPLYIGAA